MLKLAATIASKMANSKLCIPSSEWRKPEGGCRSPALGCYGEDFGCGIRVANANGRLMGKLESPQGWTIREVDSRQFKGPPGIVATAGIKLRTMVGKSEQVIRQQRLETGASGQHMRGGLRAVSGGCCYVCEPP